MVQFVLIFLGFIFTSTLSFANPVIAITQHQPQINAPTPPNIDSKGFILIDANSGKVLAEKNADERLAPASLTKLMTMYVISKAIKNNNIHLDDKVRVSTKAWQTGGSRMFIKVNDDVPVQELLKGIIVASGNDASVAMAEHIAGSEDTFANLMNDQAKLIGMKNSHFVDSNGLPNPDHYSTARDLALLSQAIIKNFPEDYKLYSEKWLVYNGIRQPNRNRLLWRYELADGLKTGHTADAGFCLVSSAVKNGMRLISVIMGSRSDLARTEDSIRLLNYGFRFFETHKLYGADKPLAQARVWKGQKKETPVGITEDFYVTLPIGQFKNIQSVFDLNSPIKAPVVKGQAEGNLNVVLNSQVVASKPLIAMDNNPKGGIWSSLTDTISYTFHKLFSKSNEKVNNG